MSPVKCVLYSCTAQQYNYSVRSVVLFSEVAVFSRNFVQHGCSIQYSYPVQQSCSLQYCCLFGLVVLFCTVVLFSTVVLSITVVVQHSFSVQHPGYFVQLAFLLRVLYMVTMFSSVFWLHRLFFSALWLVLSVSIYSINFFLTIMLSISSNFSSYLYRFTICFSFKNYLIIKNFIVL